MRSKPPIRSPAAWRTTACASLRARCCSSPARSPANSALPRPRASSCDHRCQASSRGSSRWSTISRPMPASRWCSPVPANRRRSITSRWPSISRSETSAKANRSPPCRPKPRASARWPASRRTSTPARSTRSCSLTPANPVYDAPADLKFAEAFAKLKTSIHLGERTDATAHAATWHIPAAHYLESWSDARSARGSLHRWCSR